MESRETLVALNLIENVGPVRVRQLLEHFGDAVAVLPIWEFFEGLRAGLVRPVLGPSGRQRDFAPNPLPTVGGRTDNERKVKTGAIALFNRRSWTK